MLLNTYAAEYIQRMNTDQLLILGGHYLEIVGSWRVSAERERERGGEGEPIYFVRTYQANGSIELYIITYMYTSVQYLMKGYSLAPRLMTVIHLNFVHVFKSLTYSDVMFACSAMNTQFDSTIL